MPRKKAAKRRIARKTPSSHIPYITSTQQSIFYFRVSRARHQPGSRMSVQPCTIGINPKINVSVDACNPPGRRYRCEKCNTEHSLHRWWETGTGTGTRLDLARSPFPTPPPPSTATRPSRAILPVTLVTNPRSFFALSLSPCLACRQPAAPFSITPPSTRKRKAAEAAIADNNQPPPKAATKAAQARNATASSDRFPAKACSTVAQVTDTGSSASSASQKKLTIATPATTTASMDSDDDFLSDVSSSGDFLDTQASEDESLGDSTYLISPSQVGVSSVVC